jgi:GNAT superfamily N-acetyltransferase
MQAPQFELATPEDAAAIAELRRSAAEELTRHHGRGHWSHPASERGVLSGMKWSQVWTARISGTLVATLRLSTRKPWAIDSSYFRKSARPLYLTDMAVHPLVQRRGIGRLFLIHAAGVASAWPADAIRLDAYDAAAGAGPFYQRCGFREVGRASYRGTLLIYFELLLDPP